jgi:hypothetical protein
MDNLIGRLERVMPNLGSAAAAHDSSQSAPSATSGSSGMYDMFSQRFCFFRIGD